MKKRVLIIEDEPNIRAMMRLTLEAADYEVGEGADGEQGLEVYDEGSNWDLVLLDQRMPGIDGLETLRRIKRRRRDARVVMVTAYASIELAVDAMKLGATDFMRKPMTPEILRGAVQAALAKPSVGVSLPEGAEAAAPEISTMTLNGFEILRPTETGTRSLPENIHRFIVLAPGGERKEVLVEIAPEVVGYVERLTKRELPARNSFWVIRAERTLGNYLWAHGAVPSSGKLLVSQIDQSELPVAAGWKVD